MNFTYNKYTQFYIDRYLDRDTKQSKNVEDIGVLFSNDGTTVR